MQEFIVYSIRAPFFVLADFMSRITRYHEIMRAASTITLTEKEYESNPAHPAFHALVTGDTDCISYGNTVRCGVHM